MNDCRTWACNLQRIWLPGERWTFSLARVPVYFGPILCFPVFPSHMTMALHAFNHCQLDILGSQISFLRRWGVSVRHITKHSSAETQQTGFQGGCCFLFFPFWWRVILQAIKQSWKCESRRILCCFIVSVKGEITAMDECRQQLLLC